MDVVQQTSNNPDEIQEIHKPTETNISYKSIGIATIGNLFEYYDFALLGYFATEVGSALFPTTSDTKYAIEVYALYAVGFLSRPFGGALFGRLGDTLGRKVALRISVGLMALPTFLTGCLPTYNQVGWFAPIILLILRILQGLSVGGENGAAAVYVYESAPRNKRGFWMSILAACSAGSIIAAAAHVAVHYSCSEEFRYQWGWRIPFWFGLLLVVIVLWGKHSLKTTYAFDRMDHNSSRAELHSLNNPLNFVYKYQITSILLLFLSSAAQHGSSYLILVFLPEYLSTKSMHGWRDTWAYSATSINLIVAIPWVLCIGKLADKFSPNTLLKIGSGLMLIVGPTTFYMLSITTETYQDWLLQFMLIITCEIIWATAHFWYINKLLFDIRTRSSIYGVGYNLGAAVFSSSGPLIGSALIDRFGKYYGMIFTGLWLSILCIITLSTLIYIDYKNLYDLNPDTIKRATSTDKLLYHQNKKNNNIYHNPKYDDSFMIYDPKHDMLAHERLAELETLL